jgi:glycosyltransferase involved in cell wall biosynthesis
VPKPRVLVLCHDMIGERMGGPGIRYSKVAEILSTSAEVTLRLLAPIPQPTATVETIRTTSDDYKAYFDNTDIIFAQWLSDAMIDYARARGKILIFDLYAPVPIEYLASVEFDTTTPSAERDDEYNAIIAMYGRYLTYGQFFTCSNERQRDYWIGFMTANHLLMPSNFASQLKLDRLALCPMGIDLMTPVSNNLSLRKTTPGISQDDFVILWTGGIWDWFDAGVIIRAMALLSLPNVKLVFLGTKHPGGLGGNTGDTAARALAKELGLLGKTVIFSEQGWIPYTTRGDFMLDANVAIYSDKESLETRFSHRTRVLDTHFWGEIPTICSPGDYMSDLVSRFNLGIVANERTPEAFANAITTLAGNNELYREIKSNLHNQRSQFSWEQTLLPLITFVKTVDIAAESSRITASYVQAPPAPKIGTKRRLKNSAKALLGR